MGLTLRSELFAEPEGISLCCLSGGRGDLYGRNSGGHGSVLEFKVRGKAEGKATSHC